MNPNAAWYGGTVRYDAPFAWRWFRHRATADKALVTVALAHPPGGPFHAVIAKVHWGTWCKELVDARQV